MAIEPASAYGRGRSSTASTTAKTAEEAPTPSASVRTAAAVNPRSRMSPRTACRTEYANMAHPPLCDGTGLDGGPRGIVGRTQLKRSAAFSSREEERLHQLTAVGLADAGDHLDAVIVSGEVGALDGPHHREPPQVCG